MKRQLQFYAVEFRNSGEGLCFRYPNRNRMQVHSTLNPHSYRMQVHTTHPSLVHFAPHMYDSPKNSCSPISQRELGRRKAAFTLAEVLITLVVVGVVAALTIPSSMALIGTKVTENQQKVFQAKLIQGLNLAKTSGDLANNFTSTED